MSLPGWPHDESPFHAGEHAVQRSVGVRERMEEIGRRVMRGVLPPQHREFFPLLPFVVLGSVDQAGQPWAGWIDGSAPGFVSSPDETQLRFEALPHEDDPLAPLLQPGRPLAVLGIELGTRRRNRANGRVIRRDAHDFTMQVLQSFGNCPQYIQRRELRPLSAGAEWTTPRRAQRLDDDAIALVRRADTFFIASHAAGESANAGSDVSHRGGRPGFVNVREGGRLLTWPEFSGNRFFNTLGNLLVDPRAGLLFVDFARGDLLHVNGRADIVWSGNEVERFSGAERLVRLQVDEALHRPAALATRWQLVEPSPLLAATGSW